MSGKRCIIALAIIDIFILIGLAFLYVKQDREPPVITLEKTFIYEENMDDQAILSNISAFDDRDGDVSQTLVVEKIGINIEKKNALITCGAFDGSGNMTKFSFRVECAPAVFHVTDDMQSESALDSEEESDVFQLAVGEAASMLEDTSIEDQEETTEEASEEETQSIAQEDDEEQAEEEEALEDSEEEENAAEQAAQTPEPAAETRPVLLFSAGEVKTSKGYNPAWVTVISKLKDDKDSYEDLLGRLKITGDFDNTTPGSYNVTVTTTDSDGNESAPCAIRIIVE